MTSSKCTGDWGCNCPRCRDRHHPMDIMVRMTPEKLADMNRLRPEHPVGQRTLCACGAPGQRFGGDRRCQSCQDLVIARRA